MSIVLFWSSVDLTGNQTEDIQDEMLAMFWSSVDLTGNQTQKARPCLSRSFGAVSI